MSDITQIVADFKAAQERFNADLQTGFKNFFTKFWEENPKVHAVVWTQYAPHFNDGDACTFSRHEMYPMSKKLYDSYKEDRSYAEEYELMSLDYSYDPGPGEERRLKVHDDSVTLEEAQKAQSMIDVLESIPNEIYLAMFDDHCSVEATREGFNVEEYDHD